MESVHELEKFALPEFFENDMNEAAADYKRCRDYMINTYRARPDYYLTIIACKNALNEDLVTLTRIHSFLEHAQLINSEVHPKDGHIDQITLNHILTMLSRWILGEKCLTHMSTATLTPASKK